MHEQAVATKRKNSFRNGWTEAEKKKLAGVIFPLIAMQKQYGRTMDAKIVMQGWQMKLAGRYSIEQILYALDIYSDKRDDFPTPANLISILSPEPPRISEAAFIEAQKWQERNGFPMCSEARDTIDRYKNQQMDNFDRYEAEVDEIKLIGQEPENEFLLTHEENQQKELPSPEGDIEHKQSDPWRKPTAEEKANVRKLLIESGIYAEDSPF